jgi:hypothetical protein
MRSCSKRVASDDWETDAAMVGSMKDESWKLEAQAET